ncbi:MAG: fibronectin/fibrinogen-binding protein [Acholeplasmataceae bacterium]|nr:fibronectin/fibrinogen-binding protein [Acholeplasmataceae bacterium]
MSLDGVFLGRLLEELKPQIEKQRINRVHSLDKNSFVLALANHKEVLVSLNADSSRMNLITREYIPTSKLTPLAGFLKKHLEGGIITSIYQVENDRLAVLGIDSFDELGFIQPLKLVLELFGRSANLLLLNKDNIILECLNKTYVLSESNRILVPKMPHQFPKTDKINPFQTNRLLEYNQYQGVSNLLFSEMRFQNDINIIKSPTDPVIIHSRGRYHFYCFPLQHLGGECKHYPTLSEMLEEYYLNLQHEQIRSSEQRQIENYLKKEKQKAANKLQKQELELKTAKSNLGLEKIGNILSTNLWRVPKGAEYVEFEDFYEQNQPIKIALNPLLSPSQNLEQIFHRYKKAKRAILQIEEQIEATRKEILYLETLNEQLQQAGIKELREINTEITKTPEKARGKQKPAISTFKIAEDAIVMVGKNNLQNNYLTHTLAKRDDYFFHVKDSQGSHTILRCTALSDELVKITAMIAAYYSKSRLSSQVPVNYTLVRNLKKVPGTKGSFVTYQNYKTVFVTPDEDLIRRYFER